MPHISDAVATIIAVVLTALIGLIAFLSNRAIFKKMDDSDKKIDKMSTVVDSIAKESAEFKNTVLKDFMTKNDSQTEGKLNNMAHKELWQEINSLRERCAKIEGMNENIIEG